ncbi:hypothetical protein DICA3_A09956 [Diutina catenulata]
MIQCHCGDEAKYKCKCGARYCSVKCYKEHMSRDHAPNSAPMSEPGTSVPSQYAAGDEAARDELKDEPGFSIPPEIQAMLKSPTLQFHLVTLLEIVNRPITDVANRQWDVAKLKLNSLRKGGFEANTEVEEFIQAVLSYLETAA